MLFEVDGVWREVKLDAPLPALTGVSGTGKSTTLEVVWWTLAVESARLMDAAALCSRVGFVARIGGERWQVTRSTVDRKEDVSFAQGTSLPEHHPVKGSGSRRSAADYFQDLLGIPRLGAGRTRVTLDLLVPWLYARQRALPNDYLGRQSKE
ncbi:hypothetical protein ACWCPT_32320 [Streptomyces sp. NPDC002308]